MLTLNLNNAEALLLASLLAQCSAGDVGDEVYDKLTDYLGIYAGRQSLLPVEAWNRATGETKVLSGETDYLIRIDHPNASREY